jgi:uncharacterized protein (UPF0332 family)
MTPESEDSLAAAERTLLHARGNLSINIPDQDARMAYYAQFHAAQALIFERTGKAAKTHKGVHKEFHRLARAEPTSSPGLASQLATAYRFKDIADYDTVLATPVTPNRAQEAIAVAERFVAAVRQLLTRQPGLQAP